MLVWPTLSMEAQKPTYASWLNHLKLRGLSKLNEPGSYFLLAIGGESIYGRTTLSSLFGTYQDL